MKTRRAHCFTGCKACRRRHLKCDQSLPQCQRCRASGVVCDFTPSLRWLISTGADVYEKQLPVRSEEQFSRRHLYTESSRESMSRKLLASVPSTVSSALETIEEQATGHIVGPFSVFTSTEAEVAMGQGQPLLQDGSSSVLETMDLHGAELPFESNVFNGMSGSLDFLQWDDLFTGDLQLDDMSFITQGATSSHSFDESVELADATELLQHFHDDVIEQMGSLPVKEKSGWRILNYNAALMTLSQLQLLKVPPNAIHQASLANLYAVIAVSSFHLSVNSSASLALARPDGHWGTTSTSAYNSAKQHLNKSLQKESGGPGKAKYKEQLMATAAILATAFLSGNEIDASHYLNEMERLIRTRGLTKPTMSRKVRLLHNIYAWMRIVSESTYVIERSCERPRVPCGSLDEAQEDTSLDDFLQLEPRHELAQDIHLAAPSDDLENMYMQIYGVPERWLRLVSQATRLANTLDRLQPRQNRADAELLAALQPRISQLEDSILAFQDKYRRMSRASPHDQMLQALSSALIIFFHRRVRDGPAYLIQNSVDHVMESLDGFNVALGDKGLLGPGTAWPCFMAGSEAASEGQRQRFAGWLEKASSTSGWRGYQVSLDIMQEIWSANDGSLTKSTWVSVCRRSRQWPLLC